MADIFDTLEEQPKTDIFDQIDVAAPSAGLPDLEAVDAMLSRQESMRKMIPGPSVTAGGPPVEVAPLSVAWQEPGEELTRPALRFSELVPPVRPDESVPSAAVKTLGRVALSVPEFFTSPLGITTAIAGPAAPKLTAGLFAADMLRGIPKEATAIGAQWDRMTPAQKTEAIISLGASALMGAGLGAKAIGGFVPKAKSAAPEPPVTPEGPPEPPPPIPKAIERVVEDYVEPEPTEVAVKAEELAAKPAEQLAAKAEEPLPAKALTKPSGVWPEQVRMEERDAANFYQWAQNQTLGDLNRIKADHLKDPTIESRHALEILDRVIQEKETTPVVSIVPQQRTSFQKRTESMNDVELARRLAGIMEFARQKKQAGEEVVGEAFDNVVSIYREARKRGISPENDFLESIISPTKEPTVAPLAAKAVEPETVPSFAARFDSETLLSRPAWVEPGTAFDKALDEVRLNPDKGIDITPVWKTLSPEQRQDLLARGWIVRDTRMPGQVVLGVNNDALAAQKYYAIQARQPAAKAAESEKATAIEQPSRDWDLFQENLNDDLESFADARRTGQIDYDMQDVAERFVDYAKQDKSGKPLDKLVVDFSKTDEASKSQIRKLRTSIKSVLSEETAQPEKGATPDATQERPVKESVQREREGTDAQRIPPKTGTSDSLQPEAQVGPPEAEVLLKDIGFSSIEREDGGVLVSAKNPKEEIGWAIVKNLGDGIFELNEVRVKEAYRKKGVGSSLYQQAASEVSKKGGKLYTSPELTSEGKALVDSLSKKGMTGDRERVKGAFRQEIRASVQEPKRMGTSLESEAVRSEVGSPSGTVAPKPPEPTPAKAKEPTYISPEETAQRFAELSERNAAFEKATRLRQDIQQAQDSIRGLEQDWKDIKSGKVKVGKFTRYPSKAAAKRSLDREIDNWKKDASKWQSELNDLESKPPTTAPATTTQQPMHEGPGALTAGTSPTGKSQIEQLADAFRNKAPTRDRAAALVRQSFDYGARQAQAKDAVSRAVAGLKAAADKTWQLLSSFEKPDDLLKAKGVLSAELETRGWRVRQFVKNVKQAMPDVKRRAAISKWIEAGGDPAELQRGEAATKPQFKQAYRDAQNLTPDEQIAAQNVSSYFGSRLQEAIDEGILEHGLDDYIHRIYARDPVLQKKAFAYVQSGILSKNPSLAKKRMFQFDWEAERAGKLPVQDFVERVADYETSLSKAIAARKFIRQMTQLHAPDGRPVIGIKGVGIPIEDQQGVRTGTIIKPLGDFTKNAKAYAVEDANGQIVAYFDKLPSADAHAASIGGRAIDNPHYRGDYINREYNALSKWKWVGTDSDGKPIFLQGDVAIHPDFTGRVDALLKPSQVRYGTHPGLAMAGRAALGIGSTFKQTMLDLSGFHQVQIAVHGLEHRVWALPTGKAPPGFAKIIKDVDFEDPNVQGLLKGGVTLGGEYHASNYGEGLFGKALTQHVPVLGPVLESYHSWLFQDFIPRVKMTMALHALERNKARYRKELASGRMTEDDLNFLTAKQANAAFGELNYTMMERNKTLQDMARIIMLAPDFLEARAKFVAQGLTKYGTEQRVALLLGATTLWALARMGNMMVSGQPHNEPENLFSIVYGNDAYSLRTVQGDVLHALTKPVQFWLNRLNPVYTRTLLELVAQRDQFGRKRDFWQAMGDTISNIVPISLRSSRERHLWESILNSIGVTAKRWNDVKRASDLAQEWKKASGVRSEPGEFIYDPDKDPVRGLKIALSEQDEGGAVKEIKRLLESKATTEQKLTEHFKRYANAHFAGTAANERKFLASLTDDQKKTVLGAYQHRKAMFQLYRRALSQYFATR